MEEFDLPFLEKMFNEVVKIAKEDNIITPDEQAILDTTRHNIVKFIKVYEEAIEDQVITEEEFTALESAYKKIYSEAESTALNDNILTPDEVRLIAKIAHTLFSP